MKPLVHAQSAAKRWGGHWRDYLAIHDFMDSSKAAVATNHHRAALHHDMGVALAAAMFGERLVNADGASVAVRDIAERHCIEDVGFVPRVEDWFERTIRPPAFLEARVRHADLSPIAADAAQGLAARFGGERGLYAPIVALMDLGAARRGGPRGIIAALTVTSFFGSVAERIVGPALDVPGRKAPLSVREACETIALARWGVVPSLHQVVLSFQARTWMAGGCRNECASGRLCPKEAIAA